MLIKELLVYEIIFQIVLSSKGGLRIKLGALQTPPSAKGIQAALKICSLTHLYSKHAAMMKFIKIKI